MSSKVLLLICCLLIGTNSEHCASECICKMENNLRAAICVNEKLTTIETNIPEQVQFLDVSDNMISSLSDYTFKDQNLIHLIILNVSYNSLSQVSLRAFEGLNNIQIVDLSDNILHSLPQDLFETNTQLLKLYLSGNKFGFLESTAILNSPSLQVLDISRCIISHLHAETFSKLPQLTSLDISRNFIIQLQVQMFANLANLKSLDFGGNALNCNQDMTDLVEYLTNKRVSFENTCQKGPEKFQRMVIQERVTEKSTLLNWSFDNNCDIDIDNAAVINSTRCDLVDKTYDFSTIFIVIAFASGLLVGVSISCCYINLVFIMKRRKKSRRIVRTYRQPRDDFLLSETSYNIGLSTPVLSRTRNTSIIR